MGLLIGGFVFCSQPNVSFLILEFRRRLAFIVVRVLSSHSAGNVSPGADLESVGVLMEVLVLLLTLCPATTFPVEWVIGVALLTAAEVVKARRNRVFRSPMAIAPPPTNPTLFQQAVMRQTAIGQTLTYTLWHQTMR